MKLSQLLVIFLVTSATCIAQKDSLEYRIIVNNLGFTVEQVDGKIFENETSEATENNSVQLSTVKEEEFVQKYPSIFMINDNCYSFSCVENDRKLKACLKTEVEDSKQYQKYSFKGEYCRSALIYITGYESWGYLSVDLNDGTAFYTMGKPMTHDCKFVISHSNYYGEEEISIIELKSEKRLLLTAEAWTTMGTKFINDSYHIKLKQWDGGQDLIRYLKINTKSK
jgi:hypothetical protein|tara:strand:+ start:108 stop:782 length:675 start_codon:yes stop_codon:yes gene_type:complete